MGLVVQAEGFYLELSLSTHLEYSSNETPYFISLPAKASTSSGESGMLAFWNIHVYIQKGLYLIAMYMLFVHVLYHK